jgi:hypothetical protein
MPSDPTHEAEAFLSLLWRNIYTRVRAMLHPHHFEHEPGGKDKISIPVGFLRNVTIDPDTVAVGQVLVVDAVGADGETWVTGAGGGGSHQVHFSVMLPATIIPPGPCNITGTNFTISAVRFDSDDSTVEGALLVSGESYAFGPGGFPDLSSGLTDTWTAGDTITLDFDDAGSDGTYLTIDMAVT